MNRFFFKYCLIILSGLSLNAQPPINQWYDFGRTQSAYSSVIATDSCYYSIGQAASNVVANSWDMVFTKTKFDGTIEFTHFLHYDTVSINSFYSNLISTYDGNFVTVIEYYPYFMFVKYSPAGDTLYTSIIKDLYLNENLESVYPTSFVENDIDSSYTGVLCTQDEITLEVFVTLVNISKIGQLNYYKTYSINQAGYTYMYPRSLLKMPDGFLISCDIIKSGGGSPINDSERVRFIKVDETGNEQWRWTDMNNPNDLLPLGLTSTPDGGYLYGGNTGWYYAPLNSHFYNAHIVKLKDDLSLDWEIQMSDVAGDYYTQFSDIISLSSSKYLATGFTVKDSMGVGWLINFNLQGDIIWDSYFSYVPASIPHGPLHELREVKQTSDNGFVMVGNAWDVDATNMGIPGWFAWLVKTDSVGCLVPGCQDFLSIEENQQYELKLSLYPNPSSNVLNIYFNDPSFTGKSLMQVYDLQGRLVKEWGLHSNDMTYIYDVSALDIGTYVLKVIENGSEKGTTKFVKQ